MQRTHYATLVDALWSAGVISVQVAERDWGQDVDS